MTGVVFARPKGAADLAALWSLADRFGGCLVDRDVTVETEAFMTSSRSFVQARITFQDSVRASKFQALMQAFDLVEVEDTTF